MEISGLISYFKTYIFPHFEEKSISSIQFNGEIINMILPTKVCINFHT